MMTYMNEQGRAEQGLRSEGGGLITALFDDHTAARRAIEHLVDAGFPRGAVGMVREQSGDRHAHYADGREEESIWDSLTRIFSTEDETTYSEGLRRGGYLVSAEVNSPEEERRAADILEDAGAVDIDERASSWRASGWESGASAATGTSERETDEDVIPVAREELQVGKRAVESGRVRVHSRVVESPVEEQVTLRDEHVEVSRQPVSGASSRPGSADPFEERTVEVRTRREKPVVSKEARIVEEVHVDKEIGERTETVRDTVRHTEIDVENDEDGTAPGRRRRDV